MVPPNTLSKREFIALMASLMAFVAMSIDAMLPAMPDIAAELTPDAPNRAQLIITSFVFGLGIGTLFVGPASDAFGRKPVILAGAVLFSLAAIVAWTTQSLETMMAARAVQGIGASAARVVALAIIRDLYAGRHMAQMVSLVIVVFSLIPAIAPTMGAAVIALAGWRAIFGSFILLAATSATWMLLRLRETLPPERRRPINLPNLVAAAKEVLSLRTVRIAILVQALCLGMLFTVLSTTQQVFDRSYGLAHQFHWWFGLIAVIAAGGGYLNSRIVLRMGMRRVIVTGLVMELLVCSAFLAVTLSGLATPQINFASYLVWTISVFSMAGLTLGNLNAMTLEPLGHVAGLAASVISASGTVGAVMVAVPIGQTFDGTPTPVAIGILVLTMVALALMRLLQDG
jgi:DHA1 family bicyclomycin/chloramphenicol resistance-like MFS transporter